MAQSSIVNVSSIHSSSSYTTIPSAKLELTYPYRCGKRVAAEFDARVSVGLEDNVLLLGEVDLFGYDNKHEGAYEICTDIALCKQIRTYVKNSNKEKARALELLQQKKNLLPSHLKKTNSTPHRKGFESFITSYAETIGSQLDHDTHNPRK
ncbi:hypothetical protein [Kiloniella sp. EL199]|uniref:hypothetical protein n=1 Tax=Kiloniella sp. EL199 TaxID=2107581 RepID=UPI0013C47EC7|nr:hypothetical protein [Kiloniella sp. EL199]